jgi:hypothetical protein
MPNGEFYEGDFVNENICGKGSFQMNDGSKYIGEFKDCKKSGNGKEYYYGDVLKYEGEYREDKFHGKGTLYTEPENQINIVGNFTLGKPMFELNNIIKNPKLSNYYNNNTTIKKNT